MEVTEEVMEVQEETVLFSPNPLYIQPLKFGLKVGHQTKFTVTLVSVNLLSNLSK